MPPKLKGKIYTTVVRPALTYGSKCWTMYERYERQLTTNEMKMCRMSLGVTKRDHIKSKHIRATLHVKETIVDKVNNERHDWFTKVNSYSENNVAKKMLLKSVSPSNKRKHSWERQISKHGHYGLSQERKAKLASSRPVTRSMTKASRT